MYLWSWRWQEDNNYSKKGDCDKSRVTVLFFRINGVQKLASSNKSSQVKNIRSCFYLAVLITWCRTAFLQPLINGVQKPVYRYEVKFMQKCGKPFSQNFSSYSKLIGFFTTSLYIIPDPIFLLMLLQEKLMVFPILFLNHQRK